MSDIMMKEITGRHVLFWLLGFFGVMLMANGIFIYFALSTFEGVDNPNAYKQGLQYNQRIEAERRQAALGWTHAVSLKTADRLELSVQGRDGKPVSGLAVNGTVTRPVAADAAQELAFEETGLGVYAANMTALPPGNWIVSLKAIRSRPQGEDMVYRIKERLWLKPNS